VFYKYGRQIRLKCKYAAQAHEVMAQIRARQKAIQEEEEQERERHEADSDAAKRGSGEKSGVMGNREQQA
jgi:hypothetical protein